MPLTLPDLDDRSYADLVAEARALIPALASDWTDHNSADPGITLVELFAWLTEMLLYRINQVTDNNRLAFLRLIKGPDWTPDPAKRVAELVRETIVDLRKPARAVTALDFEGIALGIPGVARARCVPCRNLELDTRGDRNLPRHADVSVVVAPTPNPEPAAHLLDEALDRARLLTTRVHVVGVRPVEIGLDLTTRAAGVDWRRDPPRASITLAFTIHARADKPGDQLLEEAEAELRRLFDADKGGPDERGWPFGRFVYISEILECLAEPPGTDFVTAAEPELLANGERWRLLRNAASELEGVRLDPDELPAAVISTTEKTHTP
jgi:hypothetical protein